MTNDNFQDHILEGSITQEWFDAHVVSYLWIAGSNQLMLNFSDPDRWPHLQG